MRRRAQNSIGRGRYGLLGLLPVLVALLLMAGLPSVRTAHADPSTGSMHVVVPTPSSDGKTVQGPVHTNVSVSASQATAGATYSLGWATTTAGCATGFTAFTSVAPVTADAGGGFSATFVWPTAAGNPGALYFICASDTANPTTNVITADQVFQVLGSAAPQSPWPRRRQPPQPQPGRPSTRVGQCRCGARASCPWARRWIFSSRQAQRFRQVISSLIMR